MLINFYEIPNQTLINTPPEQEADRIRMILELLRRGSMLPAGKGRVNGDYFKLIHRKKFIGHFENIKYKTLPRCISRVVHRANAEPSHRLRVTSAGAHARTNPTLWRTPVLWIYDSRIIQMFLRTRSFANGFPRKTLDQLFCYLRTKF